MTSVTTFSYTGSLQSFVVPTGVTSVDVECWGAQGGASNFLQPGGNGGYVKCTLAVTAGETLYITVGQSGAQGGGATYGGGASCAGYGGGSGGGASDVRQGGTALANRKAVGGGGGGAGDGGSGGLSGSGGVGGPSTGGTGNPGGGSQAFGGTGGTQSAGGNGGSPGVGATAGTAATNEQGAPTVFGSGAGGGGYFGGGSGAYRSNGSAGGGGGSNYTGGGTAPTSTGGARGGDGQVVITVVNAAPTAPTLNSPVAGAVIDRTVPQRFSWTFNDPDAGDSQSKLELRGRGLPSGSWVTVSSTTPNNYLDFPSGWYIAADYEWQVRTYDQQGVVGPWSSSAFFTAATPPPGPTITAPISGGTIPNTPATLTWSYPTQTNYQVRRVADASGSPDTGTVYYDSGDVVSSSTHSVSLAFPVNGRYEHLQVRVKDSGLWSAWASIRVLVSYTPPATPTLAIATDTTAGSVTVTTTNPTVGGTPAVVLLNIFRRIGSTGTPIRVAKNIAPNSAWTDRTVASRQSYQYQAVAVAANGTSTASAWSS